MIGLLRQIGRPQEWMQHALCAQTDPEVFFPEVGESVEPAKRVCRRCDVRVQCLDWALQHGERYGVWGGTSERERRALRREEAA